jgi:hypothetical protein
METDVVARFTLSLSLSGALTLNSERNCVRKRYGHTACGHNWASRCLHNQSCCSVGNMYCTRCTMDEPVGFEENMKSSWTSDRMEMAPPGQQPSPVDATVTAHGPFLRHLDDDGHKDGYHECDTGPWMLV